MTERTLSSLLLDLWVKLDPRSHSSRVAALERLREAGHGHLLDGPLPEPDGDPAWLDSYLDDPAVLDVYGGSMDRARSQVLAFLAQGGMPVAESPGNDAEQDPRGDEPEPVTWDPPPLRGDNEALEVPSPNDPMAVARQFTRVHHTDPTGMLLVRHHRGGFYSWDGTCWPELEGKTLESAIYHYLEAAHYLKENRKGELEPVPFEPNRWKVANVIEALEAIGHLTGMVEAPAWLDPDPGRVAASDMVAMANGIFHVPTRDLLPPTPGLWVHHSLPFDYDLRVPSPKRWLRFLAELWPEDAEAVDTLGEIFGYLLTTDTRLQKLFMLVGPKRSGKGTIGRVATGLLGRHNVAAPTMAGLGTDFGLAPLIHRPLAIISDARLSARSDTGIVTERLLSISGEDSLTVDRKYQSHWTGKLPTRFLILTNELPRLDDSAGALASRFIVLILTRSFYGREDPGLTDTLLEEAPGILNWALDGLDRLRQRGHFIQPASSEEAVRQLEDLGSPVGAFVRDRCEVGPFITASADLWEAWKAWCNEEGRDRPGTRVTFFRNLNSAVPGIRRVYLREGDERQWAYNGIGLVPKSVTQSSDTGDYW